MNDAPSNPADRGLAPSKTLLNAKERRSGAVSRKVAFAVMAAIAVAACLVTPYSWGMWMLTASECLDTFFLPSGGENKLPKLLGKEEIESFHEQFIALDISSFSALILSLLFTRLAYVGIRDFFQWAVRERDSYFDHAHHGVLYSEAFDTLAIRMGLLGTLLSFLLAAVMLMRFDAPGIEDSGVGPSSNVATAVDPEEGPTGVSDINQSSTSQQPLETSDLSGNMFLILCASLVSTFVGTGVAYVITPTLNWLHDRAVGRHQIGDAEAELVAEEFFRQIARTSERLAQFETTTQRLGEVVDHITRFETNVGQSSQQLSALVKNLQHAIRTFEISNHTGQELVKKLAGMEAQNDKLWAVLERLPDKLTGPLDSITRTSQRFKDAAQAGELAFRELKTAAGTAHESLKDTNQRSKVTWKLLHEVRDSLAAMAKGDRMQTDEVARLVRAMEDVSESLGALVDKSGDSWTARGVFDDEIATIPAGLDHAERQASGRRGADGTRRSRSWWRRWLG